MKKPKLVERKFIGINTLCGGKALPQASALYEEFYSDGTSKLCRGLPVRSCPGIDDCKSPPPPSYRPDLQATIEAASVLNRALSDACLHVDSINGKGEFRHSWK